MLKDIPQTLTCPVCRSQIPFTLSGLLLGERFTCPGCPAIVSLSTESRQTVQSVTDEFDRILHRQTFMENDLPSVAQKFTGLPWEELIGSSLNAAENAEAALAMYMTRFLKEHGLEDSFESILIEMRLEHPHVEASDADRTSEDKRSDASFSLPLSAVIPFGSLGIETRPFSK